MIELTASDGDTFSAYRADPPGPPKGAVVVLQEVFGVNSHIRSVTDTFAANGYLAIAPSLFDPVMKGVELDYDEPGVSAGAGKVAIVGYGWGGYLAYAAGNRVNGLACSVGYYGGGIADDYGEKRKIPTLLHFGENDALIPPQAMDQFRSHRPDVSAFSYPGAAHGFNCDQRDSYQEDAARKALDRSLSFISQYVEGQRPIALKNAGAYAQAKVDKKKKKKEMADELGPPMD
jgi:carboxymethylenebutenolidase